MMKKFFLIAAALCLCVAATANPAVKGDGGAKVTVDPSKQIATQSPWLYASGTEDVNHENYGGVYSQLIFGESFEEGAPIEGIVGFTDALGTKWNEGWGGVYPDPKARSSMLLKDGAGMTSGSVEAELRFECIGSAPAGICLKADDDNLWEIGLVANGRRLQVRNPGEDPREVGSVKVNVHPWSWNKVKVDFSGGKYRVSLNDETVFLFNGPSGKNVVPGIYTKGTYASFRNFRVDGRDVPFNVVRPVDVSSMWTPYHTAGSVPSFSTTGEDSYNGCRSQKFSNTGKGRVGVSNMGLNHWGIGITRGQPLEGKIFVKGSAGKLWVALQSEDGAKEYAKAKIGSPSAGWTEKKFMLKPSATDPKARFVVYVEGRGDVTVDYAYLSWTGDAIANGWPLRADICQGMIDEGLTFLRYGGSMTNAQDFSFKDMTGPREKRAPYRGQWYHYSSNGFGIVEFLQLAEAINCESVFAVNIEEDPETMKDMVHYLKDPAGTPWGDKRAADGHPAPYAVKYIEIGNEEGLFDRTLFAADHYVERYNILADAILGEDSSLQLVNSFMWTPERKDVMERVFRGTDGKCTWWDLHTWTENIRTASEVEGTLTQMEQWFKEWNPNTTMKCAIFEENGPNHDMLRAIGHAINLNAVRRHGDFVLVSSAANALEPYLQNDNGWNQGQVFFTTDQVWGMPPFYATRMARDAHQDKVVEAVYEGGVDASATVSDDGRTVVVHLVNPTGEEMPVSLDVKSFGKDVSVKEVVLSGELHDDNLPETPEKIVPVEKELQGLDGLSLRPWSYTILYISR